MHTILVVDDELGIRQMTKNFLQLNGFDVITAENGKVALEKITKKMPDLILLDIEMPEMDGFSVLEQLRERESTRDIPVILLTAHILSDADLDRCHRGVATILGKGLFTAEEMLHHVETALTRQHPLSRSAQGLVRRAMTYIHAHYSDPLNREEIAEHIGISADYLTDCFHQELGITPITYIRRYRIRRACELLRDSDESITQIALAVGFSDGAHFTRAFTREVGVSPRTYRRSR